MFARLRALRVVLFVAVLLAGAVESTASQTWPRQPVRIVVPFPPGTAIDIAARIIGDGLAKQWQQPVLIDNRPGGETTIGTGSFVAARDDHALLYTTFGTLSVVPLTVGKLPFDPEADLVALVPTVSVVVVISTTSTLAVNSLADLEAVVRARPGALAWSSSPALPRYVFATFLKQRGLSMKYVAYQNSFQPQIDLGESRIHAFIAAIPTSAAAVAAGKARFIATTEPRRSALLPGIPTAAESGHHEFTFLGGAGLFGWKGIDPALRDRIVGSVNAVLSDPGIASKLEAAGQQVIGGGPEKLRELIEQQRARVLEISRIIELDPTR